MQEKEIKTWESIYGLKNDLVNKIVKAIGERTLDVSKENVYVFAIEHHGNEGVWGNLVKISKDGFVLDFDRIEMPWKDMIVEDLAMVYDYLTTGCWS